MKWAGRESILLCAILLVTALVYANSLHNPFITDDRHIILNNFQPWQTLRVADLFSRSLFSTAPSESSYFRPLTLLTFGVNYPLAGPNPAGYRVVNIALHLGVIALTYLLLAHSDAERIFSTATSVQPQDPWFRYVPAIHRLKMGRYLAAVEPLIRSIELQPSLTAYHVMGSIYLRLRLGQKKHAERSFSKAILMYPGQQRFHSGVHVDLGKLYLRQGKIHEAKEEWQLALHFEPGNAEARKLLQNQVGKINPPEEVYAGHAR